MTGIIQRNCKGLRAIYEEVRFLMNRFQIFCICLQEVILENIQEENTKSLQQSHPY